MWSKLPVLIATAVFLIAVCIPVTANDGRVPTVTDDQYDEHPWGGDHYDGDDPGGANNVPIVSGDWGNYYFTVVALDYYWISIKNLIVNSSTDNATDNATGNGVPQTPPVTQTAGNPNDGARN